MVQIQGWIEARKFAIAETTMRPGPAESRR